jgi:transmembrane sensor
VTPSDLTPSDAQREQARIWFARREAGLGAQERDAFETWLSADPRHATAFTEAELLWAALEAPARLRATELGRWVAPRHVRSHPLRWAGAGLAAACLGFVLWLAAPTISALTQDLAADAATARGEIRGVTLPDGSRAELGPDTALSWRFDAEARAVSLLRGEAFFSVRTSELPFTVTVDGEGTARVLGTRFDVARDTAGMAVVVEEGRVEVSDGAGAVVLSAGQTAAIRNGRLGDVSGADLGAALAWRTGAIVFFLEPLSRVVEQLERQAPGRIVIMREGLRDLRVSGAFPAGDRDGTLRSVADTLGARVVRAGPWLAFLY